MLPLPVQRLINDFLRPRYVLSFRWGYGDIVRGESWPDYSAFGKHAIYRGQSRLPGWEESPRVPEHLSIVPSLAIPLHDSVTRI